MGELDITPTPAVEEFDYSYYLDHIDEVVGYINGTTENISGQLDVVNGQLQALTLEAEKLAVYGEYICGASIFIIVVVMMYFSYKFLRIFF